MTLVAFKQLRKAVDQSNEIATNFSAQLLKELAAFPATRVAEIKHLLGSSVVTHLQFAEEVAAVRVRVI